MDEITFTFIKGVLFGSVTTSMIYGSILLIELLKSQILKQVESDKGDWNEKPPIL